MLSILKRIIGNERGEGETQPSIRFRMSLDERKAYRREMLYQSIRESLLGLEVLSGMYKFKVLSLDERHHQFLAMIEVTSAFAAKNGGRPIGFPQIEEIVKMRAFERYGIVLQAVYWRVNQAATAFARGKRASDAAPAPVHAASGPRQREIVGDLRGASVRLSRSHYEPVSEQERVAFAEALKEGCRPPAIHVGQREYESDVAPLEATSEAGGTQYGHL